MRVIVIILSLVLVSCDMFGGKITSGVLDEVVKKSDTLTKITNKITGTNLHIAKDTINSIIDTTLPKIQNTSNIILDSVNIKIKDVIGSIPGLIFSDKTRASLNLYRDDLLGKQTIEFSLRLRDSLLGSGTRDGIKNILSYPLGEFYKLNDSLKKSVSGTTTTIKSDVSDIIYIIFILVLIIIIVIGMTIYLLIREKRKDKVIKVLTNEIEKIEDFNMKSNLKSSIKNSLLNEKKGIKLKHDLEKTLYGTSK